MTHNSHLKYSAAVLLAIVLFATAFARVPSVRAVAVVGYEYVALTIAPSAARAYEYGARHFDALRAADYDLDRAEYFFNEAAKLDPTLLYANHELARISFLRGNFNRALAQIDLQISLHSTSTPKSYYVRGLIEGFMGDYDAAAGDYETYLRTDPTNWAASNDYAWVLLKADRPQDALVSLDWGLLYWPQNAWLHNSRATALFEMGRLEDAHEAAAAASRFVANLTEAQWLQAYPGNDPLIAPQGIEAFKKAVEENVRTIEIALEKR